MRPDPGSSLPRALEGRETRTVCVSRGPAQGIGLALPWAIVMWATLAFVAVWLVA